MLKKIIAIASLFFSSWVFAQTDVVFCKEFDMQTFTTNSQSSSLEPPYVSWFFKTAKPFNQATILVSVYASFDQGKSSQVYLREEIPVNPAWNALGFQDSFIPDAGLYDFVVSDIAAKNIYAQGRLEIKEKSNDAPIDTEPKKEPKKAGISLESLFNKFAPK